MVLIAILGENSKNLIVCEFDDFIVCEAKPRPGQADPGDHPDPLY
jgi:hypothetical protein